MSSQPKGDEELDILPPSCRCSFPRRDIYYKDPTLFGRQRVVDRYVDHIASTFDVQRRSLNVVSTNFGSFPSKESGLSIWLRLRQPKASQPVLLNSGGKMVVLCKAVRRQKYCANHVPLDIAILRSLVVLLGHLSTRRHGHRLDKLD